MRVAGKGFYLFLLLTGLHVVGTAIDLVPYVGSPQIDYVGMDIYGPFWPQLVALTLPYLLTGLLMSVFAVAGLRGRFPSRSGGLELLLLALGGWALAILMVRVLGEAVWRWPVSLSDMGWIARYAVVNAAVSGILLLAVQQVVTRYAGWSARPRTRWVEAGLWFMGSMIVVAGFNFAMTLIDGLPPERLLADTWQGVLIFGGLLALAVALTPRPATPSRPGGTRTPNQTVMSGRL